MKQITTNCYRPALNAAFIFACISVALGAMGAHMLKERMEPDQLNGFETAVKYMFYHSFALALAGILYAFFQNKWIRIASAFFIAGIILFSGSIFLLIMLKATSDIGLGKLGLLTPIGGICFIIGWICLMPAIKKDNRPAA